MTSQYTLQEESDNVYLLSHAIINIIEQNQRCNSLRPLMAQTCVSHHFSAAGCRGSGWPSLLVYASHRPCSLLPLPRPPPLSNRLYHYLSATAQFLPPLLGSRVQGQWLALVTRLCQPPPLHPAAVTPTTTPL